jgi:integrase
MANNQKPAQPINRNGYWYLVRRVPTHLLKLEGRRTVLWSTGIPVADDPRAIRARIAVLDQDQKLQRHWNALLSGAASVQPHKHEANLKRAAELRLPYMPSEQLVEQPLHVLLQRFALLIALHGEQALVQIPHTPAIRADLAAALGATAPPTKSETEAPSPPPALALMTSQMIAEYEMINASTMKRKSPRQIMKWRTHRQRNLDIFLTVIGGDKLFVKLTRQDAQALRAFWLRRVEEGDVRINSANREIREISGLYSTIRTYHQIDGPEIFSKLLIPGGEEGKRMPFDPDFVQREYLAQGRFDCLNPEARGIIYLSVETGLRPSEACALDRSTIILNAPVPYVDIQEFNRTTKTKKSVRQIPLVGVALMAMRAHPDGFPRYRDKSDSASTLINRTLDNLNLRPGGKNQTLYSMRHTIIDRLKAVEAPKDIQEDILGHSHMYGDGTTLEHKHRWLQKIAFTPPTSI